MALRGTTEPGHYLRGPSVLSSASAPGTWTLEFQVVLTEDEFKSLKVRNPLGSNRDEISQWMLGCGFVWTVVPAAPIGS